MDNPDTIECETEQPWESGQAGELWAGREYRPLPYESTASVAGRFAYCNAVSGRSALKKTIGYYWGASTSRFPNGVKLDAAKLKKLLNWDLPREEQQALGVSPALLKWMFCERFRYCPVCARMGYHSFWHQFLGIGTCPIHHSALMTTCPTCRDTVGRYGDAVNGVAGAFFCTRCGSSLVGEAFSLAQHEVLRANQCWLNVFRPLQRWFSQDNLSLKLIEQIVIQNDLRAWSWCEPGTFLCCAAQKIAPGPIALRPRMPGTQVTALHWKIQMTSSQYPVDAPRGRNSNLQHHFPAVYVATLRKLHSWVFDGMNGAQAARDMRSIMETGYLSVEGRTARQIALALFRACFELCPSTVFGWTNPAEARVKSSFLVRSQDQWLQRLPLRALLLGSFAILFHSVLRQMQQHDRVSLLGHGTGVQIGVPLVHLPSDSLRVASSEICEGFVLFPTIPGLDLHSIWPADLW
ncbi:TniQ family protein [Paraburkholderia bengalensis]|uniref:TniQ family protein n=1 Tax=Paraburkholderia bengalensis TaxID=2747562 RepID=A0ABU8IL98_9BURK